MKGRRSYEAVKITYSYVASDLTTFALNTLNNLPVWWTYMAALQCNVQTCTYVLSLQISEGYDLSYG